jgi:23S rRNA pseudouridine1911/1915/1917 synthase
MSYSGHPVLGDPLYGGERPGQTRLLSPEASAAVQALQGQGLHAGYISIVHPVTRETMSFDAPPPSGFLDVMAALDSGFTPESLLQALRAEPSSE